MTWQYVDRVTVRHLPGGSFIGEARTHATFVVGAICKDPVAALNSAAEAMTKEIKPRVPDLDDLL